MTQDLILALKQANAEKDRLIDKLLNVEFELKKELAKLREVNHDSKIKR